MQRLYALSGILCYLKPIDRKPPPIISLDEDCRNPDQIRDYRQLASSSLPFEGELQRFLEAGIHSTTAFYESGFG
jgi:hypothetical protein